MNIGNAQREKLSLEHSLQQGSLGFAATYMALGDLCRMIHGNPRAVRGDAVVACRKVLESPDFAGETQAFFLYKRAAEALSAVITASRDDGITCQALETIEEVLGTTKGPPHRASAEAIGSLPLAVCSPEVRPDETEDLPEVTWSDLLRARGISDGKAPRRLGRSLVVRDRAAQAVFVVKLAFGEEAVRSAATEAAWMEYLGPLAAGFPVRFDVPEPIRVAGRYVFALKDLPAYGSLGKGKGGTPCGIGFIAHRDYFSYPNDHRPDMHLDPEVFTSVIFQNARLFGSLAARGIIHSAPIPLFHNRVQRGRRPDLGLYEWERGGRLDRWLQSCRFPNFGKTGIRDFEHIRSFSGSSRELYRQVGSHLLGLFLTVGSYFRHKDPSKIGFDDRGGPVDVRELFDPARFAALIDGAFRSYYEGFTGQRFRSRCPVDLGELIPRMIDEMGVDRHMEETLRVQDQIEMSEEAFREFLRRRGYSDKAIAMEKKGIKEIVTYTGPHLGGFNQGISIPELIEAVGTMAALSISGRYRSESLSAT